MTQESRLFVIGDSFSVPPKANDATLTWPQLVANQLTELSGRPVRLINNSIMGASQDWCWFVMLDWLSDVTANDYVIVALTHPGRYWFVDNIPELSNANIIDLDRFVQGEQLKAIELFIKHIQRPSIDTLNLVNRMAALAYHVVKLGLRRPLMLKAFEQELSISEAWTDELNFSKGVLMDNIQFWEFDDPHCKDHLNTYFRGLDCRYNHMILSNHKILADRIALALHHDKTLDLAEGFIRGLITKDSVFDDEFCQREFDMQVVAKRRAMPPDTKPILPWKRRRGLDMA
jgi:hypothetical protein